MYHSLNLILTVTTCALVVNSNIIVTDNKIEDEGAKVFAEALKVNKSLTELNLRGTMHTRNTLNCPFVTINH